MPSLRHKNHYISVVHLPDKSGKSACICCVEIRHEWEQVLSTRLMLDQGFDTEDNATEHGLAAGKRWVDERSGLKGSHSNPGDRSAFLRLGMRLSPASIFFRS